MVGLVWPLHSAWRAPRDRVHAWRPAGMFLIMGAGRSWGLNNHGGRPYESTGALPAAAHGGDACAVPGRLAASGWPGPVAAGGLAEWRLADGLAEWRAGRERMACLRRIDGLAGGSTSPGPNRRARKRPKELVGTSVRRVQWLRTSPQSLVVAESLARWPCDLRTWSPGPSRGSLLEPVWRFNLPLRARRNVRRRVGPRQCVCPRISAGTRQTYPRTCRRCGQAVDTLMTEV